MHRSFAQIDNIERGSHAGQQRYDMSESSRGDKEFTDTGLALQTRSQNIKNDQLRAVHRTSLSSSQTSGIANLNPEKRACEVSRSHSVLKRAVVAHHRSQAVANDENLNPSVHGGVVRRSRRRSKGKQDRAHAHTMAHLPRTSRQRAGAIAQIRAVASSKDKPIPENRTDGGSSSRANNGSPSLTIIEQMLANRLPSATTERQLPSAQSLPAKALLLSHTSPAYPQPDLYSTQHPKQKHSSAHRAKSLFQKSFFLNPRGPQATLKHLRPENARQETRTPPTTESDVRHVEDVAVSHTPIPEHSPPNERPDGNLSTSAKESNARISTTPLVRRNDIGSINGRMERHDWERGVLVKVLRDQVKSLTEMLSTKDTEFAEKLLSTKERHQSEIRRLRQKTVEVREEYANRNEFFRTLEKGYNENSKQASAQIQGVTCENKRLKFENQSLLVELRLLKDQPSNAAALNHSERARYQSEIQNLKAMIWEERQKKSKESSLSSGNSQPSSSTRPAEKARTEDMMKVYQRTLSDLKVTKERSMELEAQLKQIKLRCEEREENLRTELETQHHERVQQLRDESTMMQRTMEAMSMENRKLSARIESSSASENPQIEQNLPLNTDQEQTSREVQAFRREIDHWRAEAARLQEEATTSQEEVIHLQNTLELARSQHPNENLCGDDARLSVANRNRRSNAVSFSESFLVPLPDDNDQNGAYHRSKSIESVSQETQTERANTQQDASRAGPFAGVTVIPHRHTELRGVIATVNDLLKLVEQAVKGSVDFAGSRLSISGADSDFRMSRLSTGSLFQVQSPPAEDSTSFDSDTTFNQEHFDKDMDTLRESMAALHTKISDFYASKYESDMQHDGCIVM